MAGERHIELEGLRLLGQAVCIFYRGPKPIKKSIRAYGLMDVCEKVQYPPAHFCQVLVPSGEVLSEIPFALVPFRLLQDYLSPPVPPPHSYDEALAAMWAAGYTPHHFPGPYSPRLDFNWTLGFEESGEYWALGTQSVVEYIMSTYSLNPVWREDDTVDFFIRFTAPNIEGCPSWCKLFFREFAVPMVGGEYEMQVDKESFYEDDVSYAFWAGPTGFNYEKFLLLPPMFEAGKRGFQYYLNPTFNFRLVVRRHSNVYRLSWPKSVWKKGAYAALTDLESGHVVGPPVLGT